MVELEWNEDESVDKHVDAYFIVDGFGIEIRIGIEQENSDHPVWISVSRDRWYMSMEIDAGSADLDHAKRMAKKFAGLLLEEVKAVRTAALMGVVEGE